MRCPRPGKTLARCIAVALIASPAFAAEMRSIDGTNLVADDTGNTTTIYDRDVSAGTAGAITHGLIGWEEVKAVVPGIAVYNNIPSYGTNQIIADCVMAPRVPSLTGPTDKACNDGFQSHKRYKMNATSAGPIDLVFRVRPADAYDDLGNLLPAGQDQDDAVNVYRMIGKLNNHTGKRLAGFRIELGFGIGGGFVASQGGDGLKLRLYEEGADPSTALTSVDVAEFPGGLFYGPPDKQAWGFFSSTRAYFTVDTTSLVGNEDLLTSGALSANYANTFGQWLPITWAPTGWFHDHDADPATDAEIVAWFDGTNWITYVVDQATGARTTAIVDNATLLTYTTTPPTVYNDDGDSSTTTGGTLYATWNAATELYTLADGSGTITNEVMVTRIAASSTLETRAGYQKGPVEDLANLNLNYFIEVGDISGWTTGNLVNDEKTFTLRITPIEAADQTQPAWLGVTPTEPTVPAPAPAPVPVSPISSGGGGCTTNPGAPFDPTLPLLLAGGIAAIALRRRAMR